jgi:hypothetical protein
MRDDERKDSTDDGLDPLLERAVQSLRREPAVSPAWRAELLARVHQPTRRSSGMTTWLPLGIAAALALAVGLRHTRVGAGVVDTTAAVATAATNALAANAGEVRFALAAPSARRVSVVGDFNRWNPSAVPMRRSPDGRTWIADVSLAPGRHVFAFAVDGGLRADPTAPRAVEDDFGVPSSVIVVPQRDKGGE